uniref:Uncharacterized protein n=1 Tax=Arundo donax TaxID=35708 RepID=A0A0A9BY41_ARUDO
MEGVCSITGVGRRWIKQLGLL